MGATSFDHVPRLLSHLRSRREALATLAAAAAALAVPGRTFARNGKKSGNRRPSPFNAFGCLNVGARCRGKDSRCCSGICGGKKPRKGKKDKRRCVAHDTGGCQPNEGNCGEPLVSCTTSAGGPGECKTTTGKAGYCLTDNFASCGKCSRDAECRAEFGTGAACIVCGSCPDGTACVGFDTTP